MPDEPATTDPTFEHPRRDPRWLRWVNTPRSVWLLVGGVTLARLLWLAFLSPLTLTEDEAHYWLWSTAPDWSYATKPPGIAWVIWCSTALFGHTEFAVRAPAALFGALGALAAADTARTITARNHHARAHTVAFVSAAITLLAPALALLGFITTIDSPLLVCWMVGVALTLRGVENPDRLRPWLLAAGAIALGALFKHTSLLLLPGLLWVGFRHRLAFWKLNALVLVALVGLVPTIVWNARHDWVTLHHLLDHLSPEAAGTDANVSPSLAARVLSPLEYLGFLLVIAGPVPMILIMARLFKRFPWPSQTPDLFLLALPLALFYLVVSLFTRTEAGWALAAPATLLPLGAYAIVLGVRHNIWPIRFLWGLTLVLGLATWVSILALEPLARTDAADVLPARRALGLRAHASAVRAELDRLEAETGLPPFVLSHHYGRASQLAFYLPETEIYCASAHVGGRTTQFDLWPATDLNNPATHRRLVARPALVLGDPPGRWRYAFDTLQPLGTLAADPKAPRPAYLATGYRGFPPPDVLGNATPVTFPEATLLDPIEPAVPPASPVPSP